MTEGKESLRTLREFYRGKRVFLTGHTGFKGAWLTRILLEFGAEVTGYALAAEEDSLFARLGLDRECRSVVGDVRDLDALRRTLSESRADLAFHLAAQPLVRESYADPVGTYSTNVMGTVHFLEACRSADTLRSIVNVTTDKVYQNMEWCWGYRETDRLNGYDPYSNSKSCSELVTSSYKKCFFAGESAPALSAARSGNVIGGGDFSADRIVPDCVRAATSGQPIVLRNPDSVRPYQHVLECLYGYLLLGAKQTADRSLAGEYNFAPPISDCVTTEELTKVFCAAYPGATYEIRRETNAPHEANFLRLDTSKSRALLGWKPRTGIREAIRLTVEMSVALTDANRLRGIMDRQIGAYFE